MESSVSTRLMDKYELGPIIGEGQFGHVRAATMKASGTPVAIKCIHVSNLADGLPHPVARELVIAAQVQHDTLVRTYEIVAMDASHVGIVMERCHGDVGSLLRTQCTPCQPMRLSTARRLMRRLLTALHALHRDGILHRDVKPSNCLLGHGGVLKLGDFGLSRKLTTRPSAATQRHRIACATDTSVVCTDSAHDDDDGFDEQSPTPMTHEVASRCYRAPELLLGLQRYGPEVDVWSAGCVMAELVRGVSGPFFCGDGGGDMGQLSAIFAILGTPSTESCYPDPHRRPPDWERVQFTSRDAVPLRVYLPEAPPAALHLLRSMLALNPQERPSATMALQHPFFTE